MLTASDLRYFIDYEPFPEGMQTDSVRGFQKDFTTNPVGHGSVQLLVGCDSQNKIITLYDLSYVPGTMNLLSQSQAEDQGIAKSYRLRDGKKVFEFRK